MSIREKNNEWRLARLLLDVGWNRDDCHIGMLAGPMRKISFDIRAGLSHIIE
jgi:hypothetical protein